MGLAFEWDEQKAEGNLRKRSVSFEEASTVFADVPSLTIADPRHFEERLVTIGCSEMRRLLVVVHTEVADVIHIISARRATSRERMTYEESNG